MSTVDSITGIPVEKRPSPYVHPEDYESWGQLPASYYEFKVEGGVMHGVLISNMQTSASGISANQPINSTYFLVEEEHKPTPEMIPEQDWENDLANTEDESVPNTDLGQRLQAARAKILTSGLPMLNSEELEQEIADRRGGHQ